MRSRAPFLIVIGLVFLVFGGVVGGIFLNDYISHSNNAAKVTLPEGDLSEKPQGLPGAQ